MFALSLLRGPGIAFFPLFVLPACLGQSSANPLGNSTSTWIDSTETTPQITPSTSSNDGPASTAIDTFTLTNVSWTDPVSTSQFVNATDTTSTEDASNMGVSSISTVAQGTDMTTFTAAPPVVSETSASSSVASGSSAASTSGAGSLPSAAGGFGYVGCVGPFPEVAGMDLFKESPDMSTVQCFSECAGYAYAAIFDTLCYCTSSGAPSAFPPAADGSCNVACPGNPGEICGGSGSESQIGKRQLFSGNLFLSLYSDTDVLDAQQNNADPTSEGGMAISSPSGTLVIYTVYTDICETGWTVKTATLTTTCADEAETDTTSAEPRIPMTTVETTCVPCAEPGETMPATVTLTLPDLGASTRPVPPAPAQIKLEPSCSTDGPTPVGTSMGSLSPPPSTDVAGPETTVRRVTLVSVPSDVSSNPPVAMYTGSASNGHGLPAWHLVGTVLAVVAAALLQR